MKRVLHIGAVIALLAAIVTMSLSAVAAECGGIGGGTASGLSDAQTLRVVDASAPRSTTTTTTTTSSGRQVR